MQFPYEWGKDWGDKIRFLKRWAILCVLKGSGEIYVQFLKKMLRVLDSEISQKRMFSRSSRCLLFMSTSNFDLKVNVSSNLLSLVSRTFDYFSLPNLPFHLFIHIITHSTNFNVSLNEKH